MADLVNLPRAAWRRQPSWGMPRISEKSWTQNAKITTALIPGYPHLIRNTTPITVGTGVTIVPTSAGRSWKGNGTYRQAFISCNNVLSVQSFSALAVVIFNNTNENVVACSRNNTYTGNTLFIKDTKLGYGSYGAGIYYSPSFSSVLDGNPHTLGWIRQSGVGVYYFLDGRYLGNSITIADTTIDSTGRIGEANGWGGSFSQNFLLYVDWDGMIHQEAMRDFTKNPWQLFTPAPSRFYLIPSSDGSTTQTVSFSVDALIQRAGLTQSTSIDALLQSAFSRSLSLDSLIAAVHAKTISLDALLQIVGTRTVSIDALLQATKTSAVSVDALVQMTLSQSLSLDALIVAASASSASTDLDALIQALKTAGISLDALLSQSKTATVVIDALIQASKTGAVSLDALITGASSASVFTGLDALIQAIQSKTISLDALLQKTYTSSLALDAYVALTQVKTVSLDALLQSMKSGVISLDAILQMTKTAMVSFDALIQAAKTGVISLDAILVFATQASVLLDAYVQKTLARGVGLDAIIGSIADMILPTGRVITVPASDRFVFVTHSDRVIQIQ